MSYIGPKKLKDVFAQTFLESGLVEVEYEDGLKEVFSKLMYNTIISEEPCDLTQLRDKRVKPIVEAVLTVLRDWGIKLSEIPYFSVLLTQSLNYNEDEALKELYLKWLPTLTSLNDVDTITIDRILLEKGRREKLEKNKPILSPFNEPDKDKPNE